MFSINWLKTMRLASDSNNLLKVRFCKNWDNSRKYAGCPDQIGSKLKIILRHNQKTYRKCKASFGIVRNMATKYVFN